MYKPSGINGSLLPNKTVCLTFDDGPGISGISDLFGPDSYRLAQFLYRKRIRATFFVAGKHAEQYPDLVKSIHDFGHIVANHTYSHPNLVDFQRQRGDAAGEIILTDRLIQHLNPGGPIYFRPPYLAWSAELAAALNANLLASLLHVGPIDQDIFLKDYEKWGAWSTAMSIDSVAMEFMTEIDRIKKGIILLHDSTAGGADMRRNNRTYKLTVKLVDKMIRSGYNFIGLDEIPAVRQEAEKPLFCGFIASNNKYISVDPTDNRVLVKGTRFEAWEHLYVEHVLPGRVALRTPDGRYLSPQNGGGGDVLANARRLGEWEVLELIPVDKTRVAFQTSNGHYLTRSTSEGGRLMANVDTLNTWEVFTFENHTGELG